MSMTPLANSSLLKLEQRQSPAIATPGASGTTKPGCITTALDHYDPATGRFIGQDPQSFSAGDTNLYRYVGNSPTNATDPTGENWLDDRRNDLNNTVDTIKYGFKGLYDFYTNRDDVDNAVSNIRPTITSQAAGATDYYAERLNDPTASSLERFGAGVGGSLSSLATEETFDKTKAVLEAALLVDGGIQIAGSLPAFVRGCGRAGRQLTRPVQTLGDKASEFAQAINLRGKGVGDAGRYLSPVGAAVRGQFFPKGAWIERETFQSLARETGKADTKKLIAALKKSVEEGTVGPKNEQGIKVLSASVNGYTHELKINQSAA